MSSRYPGAVGGDPRCAVEVFGRQAFLWVTGAKCSSSGSGENWPPGSGLSGHAAQRRGPRLNQGEGLPSPGNSQEAVCLVAKENNSAFSFLPLLS